MQWFEEVLYDECLRFIGIMRDLAVEHTKCIERVDMRREILEITTMSTGQIRKIRYSSCK